MLIIHQRFADKQILPTVRNETLCWKQRVDTIPVVHQLNLKNVVNIVARMIEEVVGWDNDYRNLMNGVKGSSKEAKEAHIIDLKVGNTIEIMANLLIKLADCLNICLHDDRIHKEHLLRIKANIQQSLQGYFDSIWRTFVSCTVRSKVIATYL